MIPFQPEYPGWPEPPSGIKIMIVGEAPGASEEKKGRPFCGGSGQELTRMLELAGIDRAECYLTNVFWNRPPKNDLKQFCSTKGQANKDYKDALQNLKADWPDFPWPERYNYEPIISGKYCRPDLLGVLARLVVEITAVKPNIIIALGNTANWATTGIGKITQNRGTISPCSLVAGIKVLSTYHPAAILRDWSMRPIAIADFIKAERESSFPEIIRPSRNLIIQPSINEVEETCRRYIRDKQNPLSVDIETRRGQIDCIGFSPDPTEGICIPFLCEDSPAWSYWPTRDLEVRAMRAVRDVLYSEREKIFQNGMYDLAWLWKLWGMPVNNASHDTMLLHHSIQPEMQKSLGFLASIYTDDASWKHLGKFHKEEKKDA